MEKPESSYNMIDWWKKVIFQNYANFSGRARRSEYWYFILFNVILFVPLYIIAIIGTVNESTGLSIFGFSLLGIGVIGIIIPSLAVVVRRLHDLNKSGWYYFIRLIPLVGPIILLVWLCTEGDRHRNNYGEDPKNPALPEFDFDNRH
ncbi:MAG: DUF805 domain-containing protein [Bacteroidota bacterium]